MRSLGGSLVSVVGPTRSVAILRSIVAALSSLGVDTELLLRRVGLDARGLSALPPRVPIELHNQIWEQARILNDEPRIGPLVATLLHVETYDVVGGIVRHSATLGDAIIRLTRFGRLLGAGFDMRLEVHGERGMIEEPHYPGPLLHLQGIFCQLAVIGLTAQRLTGERLQATEYRVIPQRPPYAAAIEELLQTPVRFGASHNALVFPAAHLHKAVRAVDGERLRTLEREAESLLEHTPVEPGFANTIEALLALGLAGESADAIAQRLNVTPRTVARRLRAEGTSFQQIRDDVRRRLAESYLRNTAMPAGDIALALGFSDATAFSRAFRRWTGMSPIRYRTGASH